MQFTIYTFGNVPVLWNVLNALAASTTSGWILSAVGMGGLIGLVYVLAMATSGTYDMRKIGNLVVSWGMICSLTMIPTTVWITDLFTGATKKVDNVPLLITAPYSLISATEQALFTRIDGALSSVSGSYISVSQYGLISPIKILMSMRSPQLPSQLRPDLYQNLQQSMKDCAMGGSVNVSTLLPAADALATLTANYRTTGLTTWTDQSGNVTDIGCGDVGSKLTAAWNAAYATASANSAATTIVTKAVGGTDGKTYTYADYTNIFNQLVKQPFKDANKSLAQTADQASTTSLAASAIDYTLNCMAELSSLNNSATCQEAGLVNADTAEQFKNDAVQNASFFTSIMYSSMAFLTFLFFSIAPIVLVVCILWPMHAARLFMAYLMFGLWVSTWAIFYAPMGYFIQSEVQNVFTAYVNSGVAISMANYSQVYADLSTKLGIAASAVASIPLISLALLSGSFFSLNSLAQRFSGEAHSDPTLMSNRLASRKALLGQTESRENVNPQNHFSQRSGSKEVEISMSMTDSVMDSSAKSWGVKDLAMTKSGLSYTDREQKTHSISTDRFQKFGHDFDKAKSIGARAQGIVASEVLNETETRNLAKFAASNGLTEADARGFSNNLAFLEAQRKNGNEDVAGMLAGEHGAEAQEKAKAYVRAENQALLGHNRDVNAVMTGAVIGQGVKDGVSFGKSAGGGKGIVSGVSAAVSKSVGDISAKAEKTSTEKFMAGKGWSQSEVRTWGSVQEVAKNVTAEQSRSIERGETLTFNSSKGATDGYSEKRNGGSIVEMMKTLSERNPAAAEAIYQRALDRKNSSDQKIRNEWMAQAYDTGLTGTDEAGQRYVDMATLVISEKKFDYGLLREKKIDNGHLAGTVDRQIGSFNQRAEILKMGGSVALDKNSAGFSKAELSEIQNANTNATQSAAVGNQNFGGRPLEGVLANKEGQDYLERQAAAGHAVADTLGAPDSDGKAHPVATAAQPKKPVPGAAPYKAPGAEGSFVPSIKDSGALGTGNLLAEAGRDALGVKHK